MTFEYGERLTHIMAVGTLISKLLPGRLLGMYGAGEEMLNMDVSALRIFALIFIPLSITVVSGFACAGVGDGYVNTVNALIRQIIVLLPCVQLLMSNFGTGGAWYAFGWLRLWL